MRSRRLTLCEPTGRVAREDHNVFRRFQFLERVEDLPVLSSISSTASPYNPRADLPRNDFDAASGTCG